MIKPSERSLGHFKKGDVVYFFYRDPKGNFSHWHKATVYDSGGETVSFLPDPWILRKIINGIERSFATSTEPHEGGLKSVDLYLESEFLPELICR
jgi:hypothetical protein